MFGVPVSVIRSRIGMLVAFALVFANLFVPATSAKAAVTFDSKADYAASFNGTDAYGETMGSVIPVSGDYTVEAWVYDSSGSGMREIVSQGDDVNNFYMGDIWGGMRVSGANELPPIKKAQWFHLAVTHGSENGSVVWVNGRAIARAYGLANPAEYNLNIGRQFLSYGEFWQGKIDEVKIWDNDRTNMVASDMGTYGAGPMGRGLLAYYDFNTPVANPDGTFTIADNSGAATTHPLTMHNLTATDFVDVAETVDWGTDSRDALVTFPRPYLNAQGGWTAPAGYEKFKALVVGGGGGGGAWIGGGGGAGGFNETAEAPFTAGTKYTIAVGMGGSGAAYRDGNYNRYGIYNTGSNGFPTVFNGTVMSMGGGKGGSYADFLQYNDVLAGSGANGGGASGADQDINGASATEFAAGGNSTAIGGFRGGNQVFPWQNLLPAAGGGGAGGAGGDASVDGMTAGNGGPGKLSSITGIKYAGGGGGGLHGTLDGLAGGTPGTATDGGGAGAGPTSTGQSEVIASSAVANTGGGGGGAAFNGNFTSIGGDGASGVIILQLIAPKLAAQTAQYGCDGTQKLNGIKVAAGHPKNFYIDSSDSQKFDAGYLSYIVTSDTARSDLWVEASGFTGGKITLANPSDASQPLGAVTAGGTAAAYFLAKASEATSSAQSHVVKVYDRKPGSGGAVPMYTCTFNFNKVEEVGKASANKVDGVTKTTVSSLGTTFTVTVTGDTGTLGAGNAADGKMMWLSPASKSSWPTGAMRLEGAAITTYSDASRTTMLKAYKDTLLLNTSAGIGVTARQYWKAVYTFRVIGDAGSTAQIAPSAMISVGATVKHQDAANNPSGAATQISLISPASNISVTSSASKTVKVLPNGKTVITYTIVATNKNSVEVEVDELRDHGDDDEDEHYVSGSSKEDGKDSDDEGEEDDHDEKVRVFSGPFKIPANGTKTISYDVEVDTCKVGEKFEYEHHSEGTEGGSEDHDDDKDDEHKSKEDKDHDGDKHEKKIGSSESKESHVEVSGNCGETTVAVKTIEVAQPVSVTTGTAVPVGTTTATIYGQIDPNGRSGLAVKFLVGNNILLTGATSYSMSATTTAAQSYSINKALTGLTAGSRYYYRLVVSTPQGDVWGATYHFDTDLPPGVPTAQSNPVTAIANSDNGATFSGDVTAARVTGGAKVRFEWAADLGAGTCSSVSTIASSGALKTAGTDDVYTNQGAVTVSYRTTGLTPSAKYCARVVAMHGANFATDVVGSWVPWTQAPKSTQSISWNTSISLLAAGGTTTVTANATSGLAVTYTSNDTSVCTVDSSTGLVTAVDTSGLCTITATQDGNDTYYAADPQSFSFEIIPPVVTTETLASGKYQSAYADTDLTASGGNDSYSNWTVSSGSLPAGITLSSAGKLSGTPTAAGVYSFGVTVESNGITSKERALQLVIDVENLTVTANDLTVTFGDAVPSVTGQIAGFVGTDSSADIAVAPSCQTTYQFGDGVAVTDRITFCETAWDENYSFTYVPGAVEIGKFQLHIHALNKAKQNLSNQVRTDPAFDYETYPNLPGGEQLADALPTGVTMTRAAGETPGDYTISISPNSVGANYEVVSDSGTFTVQTPLIVPTLDAADFSVTYGEALGSGLVASAKEGANSVAGTYEFVYLDANSTEWSLTQSDTLPAGTYTVKVRFTADDQVVYYPTVETTLTLEVKQKTVTITADELEKLVNDLDPNLTYASTGFVGADGTADLGLIDITRVAGEDPGTYNVSTSGGSNPNYVVVHAASVLNISNIAVVLTDNSDGTTGRNFTVSCQAAKKGSTITVDVDGAVIGTITVSQNGTCPNTTLVIPNSITSGVHVVTATGLYPSGRTGLTNFGTAVFAEPPTTPVLAPPGKPGTPVVTATDKSATLTWTAPTSGGAVASYTVASYPAGAVCKIVGLSASCTGLTNGTAYTFTVTAVNASGTNESDPSASVTPRALVIDDPNATTETESKSFKGITGSFTFPGGSGVNIDKKGKLFVKVSSIYLTMITGKISVTYKQGSAIKVYTCSVKKYGNKKKMSKQPTKRMLYVDPKGCQLPAAAFTELKSNVISIKAVVTVERYYATTGTTKSPKSPTVLKPVKRTMFMTVGAKG